MTDYQRNTRDQHLDNDGSPKRILALDGGGLRGVLTLGILEKVEDTLRARHGGDKNFRLCHYFDLIAGTSTGSIIAAALAIGMEVNQIRDYYMKLGATVFQKNVLRTGFFRAKYDEKKLKKELKTVFGAATRLGGDELQTGLLVVTKRMDTGSPWPISNNPRGRYFTSQNDGIIGNSDYHLWKVVRASTAAPTFFDPKRIVIAKKEGYIPTIGEFVDGAVSPFNNPALQALMYATLEGYCIGWPMGSDNLLLVSVGTGNTDPAVERSGLSVTNGIRALTSLIHDCSTLQEIILQWMSCSSTAREIDSELEELGQDLIATTPLLTYLRYNIELNTESIQNIKPDLKDIEIIKSLSAIDDPKNMKILYELGMLTGNHYVKNNDFLECFDLPSAQGNHVT